MELSISLLWLSSSPLTSSLPILALLPTHCLHLYHFHYYFHNHKQHQLYHQRYQFNHLCCQLHHHCHHPHIHLHIFFTIIVNVTHQMSPLCPPSLPLTCSSTPLLHSCHHHHHHHSHNRSSLQILEVSPSFRPDCVTETSGNITIQSFSS